MLGGHGFLRFSIPMFPEASDYFAPLVFALSIIAIIYTSLVAFRQTDIKKLIDTSVAQTREGTDLVRTAGDSMQEIVTAVARVSDVLAEINAATQEQSQGVTQVNQAVNDLNDQIEHLMKAKTR